MCKPSAGAKPAVRPLACALCSDRSAARHDVRLGLHNDFLGLNGDLSCLDFVSLPKSNAAMIRRRHFSIEPLLHVLTAALLSNSGFDQQLICS
jgi:hypothetical protein